MIITFLPQIDLNNEMAGQGPLANTGAESASFMDALLSTLSLRIPVENAGAANAAAFDEKTVEGVEVPSEQKAEVEEYSALTEAIGKEGEAGQAARPAPAEISIFEQGRALAVGQLIAQNNLRPEGNEAAKGQESAFVQVPARGLAMGRAVAIEAGAGFKTGLLAHAGTLNEGAALDVAGAGQAKTPVEAPAEDASRESAAGEAGSFDVPEMMPVPFETAEIDAPVEKITKDPVRYETAEIAIDRSAKGEKAEPVAPVLSHIDRPETDEAPETVEGSAFEPEAIEEVSLGAGERGFESDGDASNNDASHQYRPVAFVTGAKFSELIDAPAAAQPVQPKESIIELQEKLNAGIYISVQKNGGEVRMKLNPEHLGELVIKLTIENDSVKADIRAESIEIKHLLEADSSVLREALGAHGLSLKEWTIGVNRAEQNLSGDDDRWNREHTNGNNRDNDRQRNEWQGNKEGGNKYGRPGKSGNIDIFA